MLTCATPNCPNPATVTHLTRSGFVRSCEAHAKASAADAPMWLSALTRTLTDHDLMSLDAIRLHFATQGKTYWAGVVQRALEALQPPAEPLAASAEHTPELFRLDELRHQPGGAYIGLLRGRVPANEAASVDGKPVSQAPGPQPASTFHIEDDRAPGKLAAQATRVMAGSTFGEREA